MSWVQTAQSGMQSALPRAPQWAPVSSGLYGNAVMKGTALLFISKSQTIIRGSLTKSEYDLHAHNSLVCQLLHTANHTARRLATSLLQQQMDNLAKVKITKCPLKTKSEKEGEKRTERKWENTKECKSGRKRTISVFPVIPQSTHKPIKCYFWVLSQRKPFSGETFPSRSTQRYEAPGESRR